MSAEDEAEEEESPEAVEKGEAEGDDGASLDDNGDSRKLLR